MSTNSTAAFTALLVALGGCGGIETPALDLEPATGDAAVTTAPDDDSPDDDAPAAGVTPEPTLIEDATPGDSAMRRLTRDQFVGSLADIFGDEVVIPPLAEPDLVLGGLVSVGASGSSLSPLGVESLEAAALSVAEQAMETAELQERFIPCEPAGVVDAECVEEAIAVLGRRVWRRPLTEVELAGLVAIATAAADKLDDFHDGFEFAIAALLQSPNFIFRSELGVEDPDDPGTRWFTDYELASRLSYFLWNTTPDDDLLDAAANGALSTTQGLLAAAQRLLDSPRARVGVRNFFVEFLDLGGLTKLSKDPNLFEHFDTQLGRDAMEETLRLIEHWVFDKGGDYRDLFSTRQTFLNPRMATLYGVPAPAPSGWTLTKLPAEGERAGILGHASFLALHAHAVSSSATRRGLAVRTLFLCQQMPSPPVDVDTSIPEPSGDAVTLRDRVAEHLENPTCATCHVLMDPIGLALENFDGIGRWRVLDNGGVIDASGDLDGAEFPNAPGLGAALGEHPDLLPCLVRTLVRYATGRVESFEEREVLGALVDRFEELGQRIEPLLLEIVGSPMFRRAGEPQ